MPSLLPKSFLVGCLILPASVSSVIAASCGSRVEIVAQLLAKYGESQIGRGLDAQGSILELYAKPDGSSWTVLTANADGSACVRDAGQNWQIAPPLPVGAPL